MIMLNGYKLNVWLQCQVCIFTAKKLFFELLNCLMVHSDCIFPIRECSLECSIHFFLSYTVTILPYTVPIHSVLVMVLVSRAGHTTKIWEPSIIYILFHLNTLTLYSKST